MSPTVAAIDCGTNSIRLLVAEVTADTFGNPKLVDLTREMRVIRLGEGVDASGEINPAAIDKIGAHIDDALSKGATRATATRDLGQQFADPTVLVGATTEMQLASEETFGPVAAIYAFDTEAEAIALAAVLSAFSSGLAIASQLRQESRCFTE